MEKFKRLPQVWKFIIIFALAQLIWNTLFYGLIISILYVIISWGILLFLPCLLKYKFKINFNKKTACLYTIFSTIILIFGNVFIDLIVKEIYPNAGTTTIWNLLMMITPYYILTGNPIFTIFKKKNDLPIEKNEEKEE